MQGRPLSSPASVPRCAPANPAAIVMQLVGMNERVLACGGALTAAALEGGGFEVRARLALDRAS